MRLKTTSIDINFKESYYEIKTIPKAQAATH